MPKKQKIKINGQELAFKDGQTILEVAKEAGIFIPALCYHPDFCVKANCRVCVVEIKGCSRLMTSCSTLAKDGMEVYTDSKKVARSRNLNIELLFAEHVEKCPDCSYYFSCGLLDLAKRYKIKIARFKDRKGKRPTYKFANAVEIDGSQCIDCRNCVEACSKLQNIHYLEIKGKGIKQEIVPTKDKNIDCIYCGQCAVHCPVASAQEQADWPKVEKLLQKPGKKIIVAQFAPSIRVSIGEEFGLPYGQIVTGQLTAALKTLGFKYVFDVNFGADITTLVEAEELLERLSKCSLKNEKKANKNKSFCSKKMPMFTSCCPAWVKYVEFFHPELIPNLTTARAPQMHSGGIIKTYWANLAKVDPKNIITVSIMPCTAKKYESQRAEMKIKGLSPVDYVLTTREFAYLLKKHGINLANLKPVKADLLNEHSGAAAIYGGSGGVMESALRTAYYLACKNNKGLVCQNRVDFKEVRGLKDFKQAQVEIAGRKLKVGVVNGIGNFQNILPKINEFDYIEVMACPGGCIGGGGQPIPTTEAIRKKRIEALYRLDENSKIRKAHENKEVAEALKWLKKKDKSLEHQVLHTHYIKRKKV